MNTQKKQEVEKKSAPKKRVLKPSDPVEAMVYIPKPVLDSRTGKTSDQSTPFKWKGTLKEWEDFLIYGKHQGYFVDKVLTEGAPTELK